MYLCSERYKSAKASGSTSGHSLARNSRHVVEHAIDKEEVPAIESLLENGHFSESAACTSAREEHCAWCLGLYEYGAAHCDTAAELAGCVAEEPVFRNGESAPIVSKDAVKESVDFVSYPGCVRNVLIKKAVFHREMAP